MGEIPVGNLKVRILEAIPITVSGKKTYLLSFQIVDGDYVSPIVRKELKLNESLPKVIEELVETYKVLKPILR